MLCGEVLRSPLQSLSPTLSLCAQGRNPYLALLAMATLSAVDADLDDIFLGKTTSVFPQNAHKYLLPLAIFLSVFVVVFV